MLCISYVKYRNISISHCYMQIAKLFLLFGISFVYLGNTITLWVTLRAGKFRPCVYR